MPLGTKRQVFCLQRKFGDIQMLGRDADTQGPLRERPLTQCGLLDFHGTLSFGITSLDATPIVKDRDLPMGPVPDDADCRIPNGLSTKSQICTCDPHVEQWLRYSP